MSDAGSSLRISGVSFTRLDYFLKAAVHFTSQEMGEEAISYYRMILEHPPDEIESREQKEIYVEAAIGITATYGHMLSLPEQSAFLVRAQHFSEEIDDRERLLTIHLVLGKTREVEGFYEKAAHHLDQAWLLAQELGNENLLKKAALMTSDFLFRQGRVDEAVKEI